MTRRHRHFVTLSVLLAFALRLVQLGADSLWYDETVSVYLAGQPAADLIGHTARDIHPPLYYLLLRGWLLLAGYPTGHADATGNGLEFMAGFFSLAFGVLLVPLTWQLARRLRLGAATATVAAWLIAVSPFGVWYSQEVRMYTLGACLGVITLLATIPFLERAATPRRLRYAAVVYALAAAAGMYTLYYFAFLLISLNLLLVPALLVARRPRPGIEGRGEDRHRLLLWLAAQIGTLLLYAPWLPVAWRQATNPPVPPWRTTPQLLEAILESWTALTLGQTARPVDFWPLLVLALGLVVIGSVTARRSSIGNARLTVGHWLFLLTAVFGPLLLILLASAVTPLYHVRYLFTYSPAFSVLLAMGVTALWQRATRMGRALALTSTALLLMGSAAALQRLWTDPIYAADDHRAAVRELAQRWRPGDVILVNAGYAYPALLTYWPLPVAWHGRLTDYTPDIGAQAKAGQAAVILQTGHVDGAPDLGWGDPRSDFFALPQEALQTALRDLAVQTDRLWHYRIYDTVNDPQGIIRNALTSDWTLFDDRVYRGEANLRVQGWQGLHQALSSYRSPTTATFGDWLEVAIAPDAIPLQAPAGGTLYVPRVLWSRLPGRAPHPVALSLRLLDPSGEVWAAHDEPLGGNQLDLTTASELVQPLQITVPRGTAPGVYDLALVVYNPATGEPLPAAATPGVSDNQAVLGQVEVKRPSQTSPIPRARGDFGPLRLLAATTPATVISPGDAIPVELLWQAAPDYTAEPLVVVVQLLDSRGQVLAGLEQEPLQGRYPTTRWQAGELVRDRHQLAVPAETPAGNFQLIVGLYRAADARRLTTAGGPLGLTKQDHVVVREIMVR